VLAILSAKCCYWFWWKSSVKLWCLKLTKLL